MNPHVYLSDPKHIEAIESIKRVDEKGYLYQMKAEYDYYDLPEAFKQVIDAGCSTFVTKNLDGEVLFCRNYDFSHYLHNDRVNNQRTGINVIVESHNPKSKYASIGVSDAYWLDFKNGIYGEGVADDGVTDISPFILCPMICMDGMNEKGLAISILALSVKADWKPIDFDNYEEKLNPNKNNLFMSEAGEKPDPYWLKASYGSIAVNEADKKAWIADMEWIETKKPDKPTVFHPILMRLVLDNCQSVEEAVAFMENFNVKAAMPGVDYHIMVADKSGDYRLIEWLGDQMQAIKINHATNHYVSKEDLTFKEGCGRDEVLKAGLFRTRKAGMSEEFAENLLRLVVQDPVNKVDNGKTQYTCIYNLNKGSMKIFSFGDMSKSWEYSI
ncbi:MAG: linear amide C-N hydrolase [Erysipelotrichaceae bacterium]|nr:linear amide C-N hydrolase [Erysipelotrichaceae bacterium]